MIKTCMKYAIFSIQLRFSCLEIGRVKEGEYFFVATYKKFAIIQISDFDAFKICPSFETRSMENSVNLPSNANFEYPPELNNA